MEEDPRVGVRIRQGVEQLNHRMVRRRAAAAAAASAASAAASAAAVASDGVLGIRISAELLCDLGGVAERAQVEEVDVVDVERAEVRVQFEHLLVRSTAATHTASTAATHTAGGGAGRRRRRGAREEGAAEGAHDVEELLDGDPIRRLEAGVVALGVLGELRRDFGEVARLCGGCVGCELMWGRVSCAMAR